MPTPQAPPAPTPAITNKALAAAWAVGQMSQQEWDNLCERYIENAYGTSGVFPTAAAAGSALMTGGPAAAEARGNQAPTNPLAGAEAGDLMFFQADPSNGNNGHVGIYLGGGEMASATPSGVKRSSILSDPYYGPRFLGWGPPPKEWQGPTPTPDLVKGAQQLLAAGAGGGPNNGGTNAMAGQPATPLDARMARLQQEQTDLKLLSDYVAAKTVAPADWLKAKGLTAPEWEAIKARVGVDPDAKDAKNKPIDAAPTVAALLRRNQKDLEDAQLTAGKTAAPKSDLQQFGSSTAPDWREKDPTTGEWVPIKNQPAPAPTAASERASSGLLAAQAGAEPTPAQVAATNQADVALKQAQQAAAEANARAQQIKNEAEQQAQEHWQVVQDLITSGAPPDKINAAAQAAISNFTDYAASLRDAETARANKAREDQTAAQQAEAARHNVETENVNRSTAQTQIADLVSTLGSNAFGGAVMRRGGAVPSQPGEAATTVDQDLLNRYPAQPGNEGESIGMRVLRQMGIAVNPTTGLLQGGQTPPAPAPAAPPVAPLAAPAGPVPFTAPPVDAGTPAPEDTGATPQPELAGAAA